MPAWLHPLALAALGLGLLCAAAIAVDLVRRPQRMAVMNPVWPINALYLGPVALWAYWAMGREQPAAAHGQHHHGQHRMDGGAREPPTWRQVFKGTMHCGAGCTLGDILAETAVFLGGFTLFGSAFGAELAGDFALAYLLGLAFQYFAIVPMRGLPPGKGIVEAAKADTLSLLAFEVGLFGWMALMRFVLFDPPLRPDRASYWFMMQVGMAIGFLTSYPVNAWLIRRGIKEAM